MGTRTPAFKRVLYVTAAADDRYFIPVNSDTHGGGTPTKAEQVAECKTLVGTDASSAEIAKPVKATTLADW